MTQRTIGFMDFGETIHGRGDPTDFKKRKLQKPQASAPVACVQQTLTQDTGCDTTVTGGVRRSVR